MTPALSPIEDIIKDAAAGRMFILVDDEDRENEGDLVIPAKKADAAAINFMAKHGRGLICLALTEKRVLELNLPLMSPHNQTRHQTAFTISIEAREGITTGISAGDRAQTVAVAINDEKDARDIISPGHVFPLVARDGGVLVRAGHTEAAVDIARLAGLNPSGVICEIMNDDGTMARLPDLMAFAKEHDLKIATIAELIAYRRRQERLVEKTLEKPFHSRFGGEFTMKIYRNILTHTEHVVFQKGAITADKPTLVRMHAVDLISDLLLDSATTSGYLQAALQAIGTHGSGVLVLLREPRPDAISARQNKDGLPPEIRDYGIGAQILLDLGIREMTLLSNSKRQIVGLDGYGLSITGYQSIPRFLYSFHSLLPGSPDNSGGMKRILLVAATFYQDLADALLEGAGIALKKAGAEYDVIMVPGAFEIPAAISLAHAGGKYDGYVALGCVIRGETTHYDYVCMESARGLNDLAVNKHAAIGYGIVTTENKHQALERILPDRGNKGAAAVEACLRMVELKQKLLKSA